MSCSLENKFIADCAALMVTARNAFQYKFCEAHPLWNRLEFQTTVQ